MKVLITKMPLKLSETEITILLPIAKTPTQNLLVSDNDIK